MHFYRAAILFTVLSVFLACPAQAAEGLGSANRKAAPAAHAAAPVSGGASGVDLSSMPVEDAIMAMFMLISEDARNDMKGMMEEMEQTRLKKAALRAAEETLKAQQANLRDAAKKEYQADKLAKLREQQAALEAKQRRILAALKRRHDEEKQKAEEERAREARAALRRQRREEEQREREQRAALRQQRQQEREAEEQRAALRRARHEAATGGGEKDTDETTTSTAPATGAKPVAASPCPASPPNCLHKPVGTFQTVTPPKTIGQLGTQTGTQGSGLGASSTAATTNRAAPVQLPHSALTPSPVKPVSPLLKPGIAPAMH